MPLSCAAWRWVYGSPPRGSCCWRAAVQVRTGRRLTSVSSRPCASPLAAFPPARSGRGSRSPSRASGCAWGWGRWVSEQ